MAATKAGGSLFSISITLNKLNNKDGETAFQYNKRNFTLMKTDSQLNIIFGFY